MKSIDIQFEVQKIHSQYGTTEMANYQIQKLFDKLLNETIQVLSQSESKLITKEEIEYRIKEEFKKHKELDWAKIAASKIYALLPQQSEWVSVEDRLPENGQFVLCLGEHQEDNDFVNETLDLYNDKKLDKKEMGNWFNPILSVQFRIIENQNCWLYPNVLDGGLVDFSDSITHWKPLPQTPQTK